MACVVPAPIVLPHIVSAVKGVPPSLRIFDADHHINPNGTLFITLYKCGADELTCSGLTDWLKSVGPATLILMFDISGCHTYIKLGSHGTTFVQLCHSCCTRYC